MQGQITQTIWEDRANLPTVFGTDGSIGLRSYLHSEIEEYDWGDLDLLELLVCLVGTGHMFGRACSFQATDFNGNCL